MQLICMKSQIWKVKTVGKTGGLLDKSPGHSIIKHPRNNIKSECDYALLEADTVETDQYIIFQTDTNPEMPIY